VLSEKGNYFLNVLDWVVQRFEYACQARFWAIIAQGCFLEVQG